MIVKRDTRYRQGVVARIGVVLLLVVGLVVTLPHGALAQPAGYTFKPLAFLGDPAPGPEGGNFTFDFEIYGFNNNRGEVAFAADLTTGGEGVFLSHKGKISQIMRSGQSAPGGGTFEGGAFGYTALNDLGDVAFTFQLRPSSSPGGVNEGVYRYSHSTKKITPVVVPEVTKVPGGEVFKGASLHASLGNRGDILFIGIISTDQGIHLPGQDYLGLGQGMFRVDRRGRISSVVSPGDPAPGGGTFDHTEDTWINNRDDIAFGAHVARDECIDFGVPQSTRIFCATSIYLRKATTGEMQSIAHQGDPAPGGGVYRLVFGPVLNNRGEISFIGDLTPAPDSGKNRGVFLYSKGTTLSVARPGDPMPGGGKLKTASFFIGNQDLNDHGDVVFNAILDTDQDGDGILDTGLYVWSRGVLQLVARTGTVIQGLGTIAHLNPPDLAGFSRGPLSFANINNRGEVAFQAALTDGRGVLLVATPRKGR